MKKIIFRKTDEEQKRSIAINKCFNLPNHNTVIRQFGDCPDYMTTYMIKNETEIYYVLSKNDRIDCAAWHLWVLWDNYNKEKTPYHDKEILLSFFGITEDDIFTEKGDVVSDKYWELYDSLYSIRTKPYVHISETHPVLRQMAKILGKQFGFAIILNHYDQKTEYKSKGYYIYQICIDSPPFHLKGDGNNSR